MELQNAIQALLQYAKENGNKMELIYGHAMKVDRAGWELLRVCSRQKGVDELELLDAYKSALSGVIDVDRAVYRIANLIG